MDLITTLLESGFAEVIVGTLQAFERLGPDRTDEASVFVIIHFLIGLQNLDLTAPDAAPITAMLQQIPSVWAYTLEHRITHIECFGMDSSSVTAGICALLFGKEEGGGGFDFTQPMIDSLLTSQTDTFSGTLAPYFAAFLHWGRAMQHLCISDVNKALLVECPLTVPLLLEMLLLDPDHFRKDTDAHIKAAIQADAADCLLQLALFEPGRALLERDSAAMDTLRQLSVSGVALTEQATLSANGALMAVLGREREPEPQDEAERDRHVMVSYQWDVSAQAICRRLWSVGLV